MALGILANLSRPFLPRIPPCSKSTNTSTAPSSRSLSAPQKVRRPSEFRQLLVVEIQDSVLYDVHSLCGTDDGILREWAEKKFIDLASDCVSNWDEYTADDRNTCLEEGYIKYGNGNSICITGLTQYSIQ